jgi:hypothetical protein
VTRSTRQRANRASNCQAWAIVRGGYLAAITALDADDPDRALMAEQCRLAAEIAGLPPLVPPAPEGTPRLHLVRSGCDATHEQEGS